VASFDASKPPGDGADLPIGLLLFRAAGIELLNIRKELPADATPADLRRALIERADRDGVSFFGSVAAYEEGEREPELKLGEVLHALVELPLRGHEDLTVSDALRWIDEQGHWSETILKLLDEMVAGKKVSAVPDLLAGHCWVVPVPVGDGYKLPVMVAVSTPFTPRKAWLDSVSFRFQEDFAPMAQMKPESLREAARALPGWLEDKESRDIADELFEEEDYREHLKRGHPGKSEAEQELLYKKALSRRAARLRKRKQHFAQVVKKVMGGTSQA
jgi:hypothetical protein